MPINNEGKFSLSEVVRRQVDKDWPAANTDFDLFVQDLIAAGNVIANGLIIRNIEVSDNILTGNVTASSITANTLVLDIITANTFNGLPPANLSLLTTDDLNEGSANLYFSNARARQAFTAGKGISITSAGTISTKGDDTGLGAFNSGINYANALVVSDTFANLVTFDYRDGASFIVFSLYLTNISSNTAYVNGRIVIENNTAVFANLLEIPSASAVEVYLKPQVYKANDQIQLQTLDDNLVPSNNLVSAVASYQSSIDPNFERTSITLNNNDTANLFITESKRSIIESLKVVNPNPVATPVTIHVTDYDLNLFTYLASNIFIPAFSSLEFCELPKVLPDNFIVRIQKYGIEENPLTAFLSGKYTTQYTILSSSDTIDEGDSVTFYISTLNIANNTELYYTLRSVSGNVIQDDFITANSGSIIVTDDNAEVTLQTNADSTAYTEGDETFVLELRKVSTSGTILRTSDPVTIKDTSNIVVATYNITGTIGSANIIPDGSNVTFNITSVTNLPDTSIHYKTIGNVISTDFVQGNIGSFPLINGEGNLTLTSNSLIGTRDYVVEFRQDSNTGAIVFTTGNLLLANSDLLFIQASGGVQSNVTLNDENYRIHTFISSTPFNVTNAGLLNTVEYLAVAGGAAGGSHTPTSPNTNEIQGAGGGAGGALVGNITVSAQNYNMIVGGGGTGGFGGGGANGSNTSAFSDAIIAVGGGGGAGAPIPTAVPGKNGGSGGGGGYTGIAGQGYPGQGYPGGLISGGGRLSAGGGGAGAAGSNGGIGPGGIGIAIQWSPPAYGTSGPTPGRWFAGGGGGGGYTGGGGAGGAGGGGPGSFGPPYNGTPGTTNTGGGGGGNSSASSSPAGSGGSGIILVKYRTK